MSLKQALANTVRHARFHLINVPEELSAERFAETSRFLPYWQRAGISITLPPAVAQTLHTELRSLLHRYIDPKSDVVCSNLDIILSSIGRGKTVDEFAQSVVLAAAVSNSELAAQHVVEWADGAPVHGISMTLLRGFVLEQEPELPLAKGTYLRRLPNDDALYDLVPESLIGSRVAHSIGGPVPPVHEFAGQPILCREFTAQPIFYEPPPEGEPPPSHTFRHAGPDRDWVVALAVACDLPVEPSCAWKHYDKNVQAFDSASSGSVNRWGHSSLPSLSQHLLTANHVALVKNVADQLRNASTPVYAATRRWLNSKKDGALDDRYIELRIALEALYTDGGENLRFAVATRTAQHLAEPGTERRNLFKDIREFYDKASGFIHASRWRPQKQEEVAAMCQSVQATVHKAILKMLSEGRPDMIDLSLGQ